MTRLYVGFTLAILICAISGVTSYLILQKEKRQREWVRQTRTILDTTNSIQAILIDMETGRRGFRATNQRRFLGPYYAGQIRIEPTVVKLKKLLSNDLQVASIELLLEKHIHDILQFWENIGDDMAIYSKSDITNLTDDEKRQMDEIRMLIQVLQKDESKLLNERREEYDQLTHYVMFSTSIESIVSGAIILALIYFILREFKSRKKIQEQLHDSVEQLKYKTDVLQKSESELKYAMDELNIINNQLEKFVYTVAHDIKSPLAGIIGALNIIKSDEIIIKYPKLAEFANLSSASAIHLANMVNFLLEYSRVTMDKQVPEVVDVRQLLEQLTVLLFPPLNVRIFIAEKMPVLITRKIILIQVFQNLISNAIKYNDKERGIIDIGYNEKRADYYEFYVKDNGQGIAKEDIGKIFTLSRTTSNQSSQESSTGFGLNIAKLIIEEQGGAIWFDTVNGKGTTFYFEWKK